MSVLEIPTQRAGELITDFPLITEPGVYDLPENVYHAQTHAMSSTTAKHILEPGCPAQVLWEMENPKFSNAFDLGTVTHRLILGVGPELVEVDAPTWQTKAAKQAREEARERGAVALLAHEMQKAKTMADAVRRHPLMRKYMAHGTPERSVFWRDDETATLRRAMLDWCPDMDAPGQPVALDVKTTADASPEAIARQVAKLHYHQQDPWYRDGLVSAGMQDAAFLFAFVGKEPPHHVTFVQLDEVAVEKGWQLNRRAIDVWDRCHANDHWPAYGDGIHTISLPAWATRLDDEDDGGF